MILSKEERLEYYKKALEVFKNRKLERGRVVYGICEELSLVVTGNCMRLRGDMKKTFPEFYSFRPEDTLFFWWKPNDITSRIEALQACIKQLS